MYQIQCRNFCSVDLLQMDVLCDDYTESYHHLVNRFDCVIMNPPFGTKNNKGIDMMFLRRALQLTNNSVYSLHKTSTRNHVVKVARDWGATVQVLAEMKFDLPAKYSFHTQDSKDIQVDMVRFTKNSTTTTDLSHVSSRLHHISVTDKYARENNKSRKPADRKSKPKPK